MKIAIITRKTLYSVKGGDTFQIINTARYLRELGITVDIQLTHEMVAYDEYDLLHFFNIVRPADIVYHIQKANKPFVVSPNLVNYQEYDRLHRKGLAGIVFSKLPAHTIEYVKTIARWVQGNDVLQTPSYLWRGHKQSIQKILQQASMVLPNSHMEYEQLHHYGIPLPAYAVIPNGIDPALFIDGDNVQKDRQLVLCVARIEGLKNQYNLIQALNNTRYQLVIIGAPAPNQLSYYEECKKIAAANISFIDHLPQPDLVNWYRKAGVHILPSWFETCGLSSLEAAAMGCNVVITDKGYAREYFNEEAEYCDPALPATILQAIERASAKATNTTLRQKILQHYTWQQAAIQTARAYKQALSP